QLRTRNREGMIHCSVFAAVFLMHHANSAIGLERSRLIQGVISRSVIDDDDVQKLRWIFQGEQRRDGRGEGYLFVKTGYHDGNFRQICRHPQDPPFRPAFHERNKQKNLEIQRDKQERIGYTRTQCGGSDHDRQYSKNKAFLKAFTVFFLGYTASMERGHIHPISSLI